MHDLVHDLALDVSQKECKTVNFETEMVDENVRHLLLCDEKLVEVPHVLKEMKSVRTVIIQDVSKRSKIVDKSLINLCVSNFKYLRALELRNSPLTALPNSICTLKHLRDLELVQCKGIQELPSSFDKLRSLQSLNLRGTHLKQLPERMQYLKSLRTLVLKGCSRLVSLPRSLKFLTKLEHLEIVFCEKINLEMEPEEEDRDLQLSLKTFELYELYALRDLPQLLLQGSSSTLQQLRISWCPELSVLPAWLLNLTSLHKLEIEYCFNLSAPVEGIDRLTNLRELAIHECPQLSKRYRQNGGEDWHKIAHIQKVVTKD